MKAGFAFEEGAIVPVSSAERMDIVLYTTPDEDEKREVVERLSMDPYDLASALDADEISRVEFSGDCVAMIWKQPKNVSGQGGASRSAVFTLSLHRNKRFYPRFYGVISILIPSCFLSTARWSSR